MIQHGVFAVAEHAVTTASATSANEARSRALALYRKWQKSVGILQTCSHLKANFQYCSA